MIEDHAHHGAEMVEGTLKDRVVAYIQATDYVSYAELSNRFSEFRDGDLAISMRENLYLWAGMTQEAVDAIQALREEGAITVKPSSLLVYLADGRSLSFPIARRVRDYKKPHWAPTTLRPAGKASA
jgi:hypothetical protein